MRIMIFLFTILHFVSFSQKDSSRFIDNFYLEFNIGVVNCEYSYNYDPKPTTSPNIVVTESFIAGDFEINTCYRNKYFKTAFTLVSFKDYFYGTLKGTSAFTIGGNVLAFSKHQTVYFGPYITYGRIRDKLFSPRYDYLGLGVDLYIRKFHIDFFYSVVQNVYIQTGYFDMKMYGLKIGYAFNLESFRKKK